MKHLQTTDFYKMKIPTNHPHPYRNGKVGGGSSDEGHHIFSGEPFENNPSISGCLISLLSLFLILLLLQLSEKCA